MVHTLRKGGVVAAFTALYFSISALAALQNITIDDQDFTRIIYTNPGDWKHDPLIGYESQFYNGSRSYTYVPGASASLSFTGSGIYLQGPFANDQALRRVTLNGQDLGVFTGYANNRTLAGVFWGKGGMDSIAHTVVVTHNDTATKIFAMDAWIVEFPSESTPFPTTTHASGAPSSFKYRKLMARIIPIAMLLLLPVYWL